MIKIKKKNSISYQEAKIGILLKEDMDKSSVKNMAKDFNISFKENVFSICLKPKKYIDENSLTNIINLLNRDLGASHALIDIMESYLLYALMKIAIKKIKVQSLVD